ncbi:MAG: ferritin-like domain-containing protein [Gemmatimonadaceae bacterium]
MNSLHDVLIEELKDIYSAERQLIKALPHMANAAATPELRDAFEHHLAETKEQLDRLDRAFVHLGGSPRGKVCRAMKGLIEEGTAVLEADGDDSVRDAALIGAAQRVEHYEMSAYGTARAHAELLGLGKVVELLSATMEEERAADEKLTRLAEDGINERALQVRVLEEDQATA